MMSANLRGQIVRFALVGGLATLTHAGLAAVLTLTLSWPQVTINTIAFLIAFCVSGIGHSIYTFKLSKGRKSAILRWFIVSLLGLIFGNLIIFSTMTGLNAPRWLAQALAIAIVPIWSFSASRLWAFKEQ